MLKTEIINSNKRVNIPYTVDGKSYVMVFENVPSDIGNLGAYLTGRKRCRAYDILELL